MLLATLKQEITRPGPFRAVFRDGGDSGMISDERAGYLLGENGWRMSLTDFAKADLAGVFNARLGHWVSFPEKGGKLRYHPLKCSRADCNEAAQDFGIDSGGEVCTRFCPQHHLAFSQELQLRPIYVVLDRQTVKTMSYALAYGTL